MNLSRGVRAASAGLIGLSVVFAGPPAAAMGYDSLSCKELLDRRVDFYASYGFCAPNAGGGSCKPVVEGSEAELPEAVRRELAMIQKTEARKDCASGKL